MRSVTDKVSPQERDNARMNRQSVTNPAEFEAGMDDSLSDFNFDDFGGGTDDFGGGTSNFGGTNGFGGFDDFGGSQGFDGGKSNMWGQSGSFNSPLGQPQVTNESAEDKFFEVLKQFFVGFGKWGKNLILSFKQFDTVQRLLFGKGLIYSSLVCLGASVLLLFFLPSWGKPLLLGSGLSLAIGVPVFMCTYDKLKKSGELDKTLSQAQTSVK